MRRKPDIILRFGAGTRTMEVEKFGFRVEMNRLSTAEWDDLRRTTVAAFAASRGIPTHHTRNRSSNRRTGK